MQVKTTVISSVLFLVLIGILEIVFYSFYLSNRAKMADIIIENLDTSVSDLSFSISKSIKNIDRPTDKIKELRSLLDRKVAINKHIKSITIYYNNKPILYTDPSNSTHALNTATSTIIGDHLSIDHYEYLENTEVLTTTFSSYVGFKKNEYVLAYNLDKEEIQKDFETTFDQYIIGFIVFPILLIIIISFLFNKFILLPLKTINSYAYHQNEKPLPYFVRELDELRVSVTTTIDRLENEKKYLFDIARTDQLIGISNRSALEEYVPNLIKTSDRNGDIFALVFLDVDNFKTVNDSLGHDVGDELLKDVATKIQQILRPEDFIARIGGDEFVFIIKNYIDIFELVKILSRVGDTIKSLSSTKINNIHITASMGVSLYPNDANDLIGLMKHADIALYKSKDDGKAKHTFYSKLIDDQLQDFIVLNTDMKEALKNSEYELFYQPQNDCKTNKILGCEALIRWNHPIKGYISPNDFIPIAEKTGFIIELGQWVLETAIKKKKQLELSGSNIVLSINIAPKQILEPYFVDTLMELVNVYGVDPTKIALEITEYIFLSPNSDLLLIFNKLKEFGFEIHLDDFGTGYSSLTYLKKFPVDTLKIDKAFLDDYSTVDGATFLETIIKMAKILKLNVIAEGVETNEQLDFIKNMDCDLFQGYLVSKPLKSSEFDTLMNNCHNTKDCVDCETQCGIDK